jgi:hypothetical protein
MRRKTAEHAHPWDSVLGMIVGYATQRYGRTPRVPQRSPV